MKKHIFLTLVATGWIGGSLTDAAAWTGRRDRESFSNNWGDTSMARAHSRHWGSFGRNPTWEAKTMPAWRGAQTSTAHGLQNPRSVCATVKRHVRYSRDTSPEEEWKDAEDTWSEGTGDCEDFAVLVKQRCRQRGVTAEVYSFYPPKGSGHAVVIGEWKGRLWMSSNGSFVEISSIEDASCRVAQSQGWDPDLVLMKVGEKSRHTAASW